MEMVLKNGFCEMEQNEMLEVDGGSVLPTIGIRTGLYLAEICIYNVQVSYINGYNDTVTSNGRPDLVKSYPERPTW